jgi:hypothetical protein
MISGESLYQLADHQDADQDNDKTNEAGNSAIYLDDASRISAVPKHIELLLGRIEWLHTDSSEGNKREHKPRDGISGHIGQNRKNDQRTADKQQQHGDSNKCGPCHGRRVQAHPPTAGAAIPITRTKHECRQATASPVDHNA